MCSRNPVITSNIVKIQISILKNFFKIRNFYECDESWRQTERERLLFVDPCISRIYTTFNQRMLLSVGALCPYNLAHHHYDFIIYRIMKYITL
jgi:hypothetical protein